MSILFTWTMKFWKVNLSESSIDAEQWRNSYQLPSSKPDFAAERLQSLVLLMLWNKGSSYSLLQENFPAFCLHLPSATCFRSSMLVQGSFQLPPASWFFLGGFTTLNISAIGGHQVPKEGNYQDISKMIDNHKPLNHWTSIQDHPGSNLPPVPQQLSLVEVVVGWAVVTPS